MAALDEGGLGTQMSSQISMWAVKGQVPLERRRMSTPKGTLCPASVIVRPVTPAPEVNQRRS